MGRFTSARQEHQELIAKIGAVSTSQNTSASPLPCVPIPRSAT